MLSFPVPVLGFLFVSFRPSLLRFPQLFRKCFPCAFAFGIFRFPSGSFRPLPFCLRLLGLLFLPFRSLPVSASQWLLRCSVSALASPVFPVLPSLVSRAFFSRFSYSASCSFPFILPGFAPTAVPPVLPFFSASFRPLLFRAFSFRLASFRPLIFRSDYSAFRSFFSLLPVSPGGGSFGACLSAFRPACFHAFLSASVLSFLRFLSPLYCFVSQALHSCRPPVSSSVVPLAFALGSGYLACRFAFLCPANDLHILPPQSQNVNTYFVYISTIILRFVTNYAFSLYF